MATKRKEPPRRLREGFEYVADVAVNLRQVALRLVQLHRAPPGTNAWAFKRRAPTTRRERGVLRELAMDHWYLHDGNPGSKGPRCPFYGKPCQALGASQAALELLWAAGDERQGEPALRLHHAIWKTGLRLVALKKEFALYGKYRVRYHERERPCFARAHRLFCEYPALVPPEIDRLCRVLSRFDALSLTRQIPEHRRGTARLGLLKSTEGILAENGWTLAAILEVVDDGNGGSLRARKDRLRKRIRRNARGG